MISYAQNGEDVVLERAFKSKSVGKYIDIGACHPDFDSVTKHFYLKGWCGINVEPDPELFKAFTSDRPLDINVCTAIGSARSRVDFYPTDVRGHGTLRVDFLSSKSRASRRVPCMPLSDLIDLYGSDFPEIDFLKIDVEGCEFDVISSCDLKKFRPRVLVLETVKPGGGEDADALNALLTDQRYVFALFDGLNRFYCREEDSEEILPALSIPANILDNWLHVSTVEATAILQTKEGSIQRLEAHCQFIDSEARAKIESLEKALTSLESLRSDLTGKLTTNSALMRQRAVLQSSSFAEIRRLQNVLTEFTKYSADTRQTIEELEGRLNTYEDSLRWTEGRRQREFDDVSLKMADFKARVERLNGEIVHQQSRAESAEVRIL